MHHIHLIWGQIVFKQEILKRIQTCFEQEHGSIKLRKIATAFTNAAPILDAATF